MSIRRYKGHWFNAAQTRSRTVHVINVSLSQALKLYVTSFCHQCVNVNVYVGENRLMSIALIPLQTLTVVGKTRLA